MANTIVTRFAGKCADCGTVLPAGSKARYYGRGKLYGTECHEQKQPEPRKCQNTERIAKRPAMGIPIPTVNGTRSIKVRKESPSVAAPAQPGASQPAVTMRPRFEIRKRGRHLSGNGRTARYEYVYEPYVGKGKPLPARLTDYEWHGVTAVSRLCVALASIRGVRNPAHKLISWPMVTRLTPVTLAWARITIALTDAHDTERYGEPIKQAA